MGQKTRLNKKLQVTTRAQHRKVAAKKTVPVFKAKQKVTKKKKTKIIKEITQNSNQFTFINPSSTTCDDSFNLENHIDIEDPLSIDSEIVNVNTDKSEEVKVDENIIITNGVCDRKTRNNKMCLRDKMKGIMLVDINKLKEILPK